MVLSCVAAARGTAGTDSGMDVDAMMERRSPTASSALPHADERAARPADASRSVEAVRRIPLSAILGRDREIVIEFNGADYRLRITRNRKLILTK